MAKKKTKRKEKKRKIKKQNKKIKLYVCVCMWVEMKKDKFRLIKLNKHAETYTIYILMYSQQKTNDGNNRQFDK